MYLSSLNNFPCHLILGNLNEQEVDNDNYRHHFRPATASDDYAELNRLWERLVAMIQYFNETPPVPPAIPNAEGTVIPQSAIRLTPSVYGAVPLSEKAVPYYYKKTDGTPMPYVTWNKHKNPLGYWYEKNEDVPDDGYYKGDNWENYDLEQYNFVRIEGHIDKPYNEETIKDAIKKIADDCHLPIEVIALKGGDDTCDLEYQKRYFLVLRSGIYDSACSVISKAVNLNPPIKPPVKDLDEAVNKVVNKVKEKAEEAAANPSATVPIKNAATAAREAVGAAREAVTMITKEEVTKAKEAVEKAKEAVATITDADIRNITTLATETENAVTTLIAAIAINGKELLPYLT